MLTLHKCLPLHPKEHFKTTPCHKQITHRRAVPDPRSTCEHGIQKELQRKL